MQDIGVFELIKGILFICCFVGGKGNISVPERTFNCDLSLKISLSFNSGPWGSFQCFCLFLYLVGGTWLPSVRKELSLMNINLQHVKVSTVILKTPVLVQFMVPVYGQQYGDD